MDLSRSVKDLQESLTTLMKCPTPSSKPACPLYPTFSLIAEHEIPITIRKDDFAWLLASTLNTTKYSSDGTSDKSAGNTCRRTSITCSPGTRVEHFADGSNASTKDKCKGCWLWKKDGHFPWYGPVFTSEEASNGPRWPEAPNTSTKRASHCYGHVMNNRFIHRE